MRFSSWAAMFSATSCAFTSGLRTSTILMRVGLPSIFSHSGAAFDLRAALADDDAGLRAVDMHAHAGGVAFDFDLRHAGGVQGLLQVFAQVVVLKQGVAELVVL